MSLSNQNATSRFLKTIESSVADPKSNSKSQDRGKAKGPQYFAEDKASDQFFKRRTGWWGRGGGEEEGKEAGDGPQNCVPYPKNAQ